MKMPLIDTLLAVSAPLIFIIADTLAQRAWAAMTLGAYGLVLFIYFAITHHSERRHISGRKLSEYAAMALLVTWAYASLL